MLQLVFFHLSQFRPSLWRVIRSRSYRDGDENGIYLPALICNKHFKFAPCLSQKQKIVFTVCWFWVAGWQFFPL